MTSFSEDVRVGDRYIHDDRKITISRIDGPHVWYETLTDDGKAWSSQTVLPLPAHWTKVASGPPEPEPGCINHPLREREPSTLYCPECVDLKAQDWAHLNPQQARDMAIRLTEVPF